MRVREGRVWCGGCDEMLYESVNGRPIVVKNLDIEQLADGRWRFYSRDLRAVIHLCDDAFTLDAQADVVIAQAESILTHAARPVSNEGQRGLRP